MFDPKGTAKLIRAELKKRFPKIKFSVTSQPHTVYVCYPESVQRSEIREMMRKHESGSYNPVEDIHEVTNNIENMPQVDYVMLCRAYS